MFQPFISTNIFLSTFVFGLLYLGDYYLTLLGARLYHRRMEQFMQFAGGYELTPVFQKDIDQLRMFSPQFFARLLAAMLIIPVMGYLLIQFLELPDMFVFLVGALCLRELAIYVRHAQNIYFFRQVDNADVLRMRIQQPRWLTYRLSSVQFLAFAVLFLILALVANPFLFLGGTLGCLVVAVQHWRLGKRVSSRPVNQTLG